MPCRFLRCHPSSFLLHIGHWCIKALFPRISHDLTVPIPIRVPFPFGAINEPFVSNPLSSEYQFEPFYVINPHVLSNSCLTEFSFPCHGKDRRSSVLPFQLDDLAHERDIYHGAELCEFDSFGESSSQ
jgi:hypothetical protein